MVIEQRFFPHNTTMIKIHAIPTDCIPSQILEERKVLDRGCGYGGIIIQATSEEIPVWT